jgi:hypothetical protein
MLALTVVPQPSSSQILWLECSSTSTMQFLFALSDFQLFPEEKMCVKCQHVHYSEDVQNEAKNDD